tara:strand:+ start:30 stop:176 length:147 start_codon:yes stop_codon:yes gene_type:complete
MLPPYLCNAGLVFTTMAIKQMHRLAWLHAQDLYVATGLSGQGQVATSV